MKKALRHRKYRSKFGSRKTVRPTTGWKHVKGWKTKLNKKPELKVTRYSQANAINIDNFAANNVSTQGIIWNCNKLAAGTSMITWPQQGVAFNQFIGYQFNMKYLIVTFVIELNAFV